MRLRPLVAALALGTGFAVPAAAAQEPGAEPIPAAEGLAAAATDPGGLPVSLDRIRQRLAATEEAREGRRDLLDLNFYVDVYARAPALDLLRNFDLDSESVSYGAPTHLEMLEAATPREWRPRAISTGNLFGWR